MCRQCGDGCCPRHELFAPGADGEAAWRAAGFLARVGGGLGLRGGFRLGLALRSSTNRIRLFADPAPGPGALDLS